MFIGYGSVSRYDSDRSPMYFDEKTNEAYFEGFGHIYTIKLNDSYITNIKQNKKIWITLFKQPRTHINPDTKFSENDITIEYISDI